MKRRVILVVALSLVACPRPATASGEEEVAWVVAFKSITDTVMAHHVDPPTRQEMLLSATRSVYAFVDSEMPRSQSTRISDLNGDEQLAEFINELRDMAADKDDAGGINAFASGIMGPVSGPAVLIPTSEIKIQRQLRENMYVGVGIRLVQYDDLPMINLAFPGGPAAQAGVQNRDVILEINGEPTNGKSLRIVVDELRGPKGTSLSILVKQADEDESRQIDMVRDVVPFQTVMGHTSTGVLQWDYRLPADPRIAYVRIDSIRGSTVREFQEVAARLHADGCKALVLDLRNTADGDVRFTSLMADALLGECLVGQVVSADGSREYRSRAANLFDGWPVAVLVSPGSRGTVEWLAAAIQDQHRGVLIGQPTAGANHVAETLELPQGIGGVTLHTTRLRRGDGRSLSIDRPANAHAPPPVDMPGMATLQGKVGVVPDIQANNSEAIERAIETLAKQLD